MHVMNPRTLSLVTTAFALVLASRSALAQDGAPPPQWVGAGHYEISGLDLTPGGAQLVTCSSIDETIKVWNTADGSFVRTLTGPIGGVQDIALSPDGTRLVSGGEVAFGGNVSAMLIWDLASGTITQQLSPANNLIFAVDWSPVDDLVAAGDQANAVRIWNATTGALVRTLALDSLCPGVAFDASGEHLVTASRQLARIWDLRSGQLMVTLSGHTKHVLATAWSDDGARVATCSNDGSSKIWNAATGDLVRTLTLDSLCPGVAFDATGERLVTASRQLARTWDAGGAPGGSFEGHQGDVTSAMFGPRGLVITTSTDGTARIWDPASQQPLDAFVHPDSVEEGDVSADRSLLASRSGHRVYLWRLDPVVARSRARALIDALPLVLRDGALVRKH